MSGSGQELGPEAMEVGEAPAVPSGSTGEAEVAAPRAAMTDVVPSAPDITSDERRRASQ